MPLEETTLLCLCRHVCEPETKEAGGWDCGGRWLMDVFRLSRDHMLGFFHAEVCS